MKHRLLAALLALGAVACQRDREGAQGFHAEVRDSAGIRIVENERPPDGSRLGWRIGPEPAMSIGELEGEEPYMLHYAIDATKLSDGRIVVVNQGSSELRVFDASGTHLESWGGRGEGPGEFEAYDPSDVAPWTGDSILAWYSSGFSLSVFDSGGDFGRSFSLRNQPSASVVAVRANGTILTGRALSEETIVVEIWDGDGGLVASLGEHRFRELAGDMTRPSTGTFLYGWDLQVARWGDLVIASPNSRYELRAFRADGTLARIVRLDHPIRATTQADLDWYVDWEVSLDRRRNPPPNEEELKRTRERYRARPMAKTFPAFDGILGYVMEDGAGHLWVREYDFPGEDRPAPLWTVFDPAGRVLGFVETPKDFAIFEIGEDYLLGTATDDLEVERVQLWPLERSGG